MFLLTTNRSDDIIKTTNKKGVLRLWQKLKVISKEKTKRVEM